MSSEGPLQARGPYVPNTLGACEHGYHASECYDCCYRRGQENGIRADRERITDARLDGWCDCELDETYSGSGEGQIQKCQVCAFIDAVVNR